MCARAIQQATKVLRIYFMVTELFNKHESHFNNRLKNNQNNETNRRVMAFTISITFTLSSVHEHFFAFIWRYKLLNRNKISYRNVSFL